MHYYFVCFANHEAVILGEFTNEYALGLCAELPVPSASACLDRMRRSAQNSTYCSLLTEEEKNALERRGTRFVHHENSAKHYFE